MLICGSFRRESFLNVHGQKQFIHLHKPFAQIADWQDFKQIVDE